MIPLKNAQQSFTMEQDTSVIVTQICHCKRNVSSHSNFKMAKVRRLVKTMKRSGLPHEKKTPKQRSHIIRTEIFNVVKYHKRFFFALV